MRRTSPMNLLMPARRAGQTYCRQKSDNQTCCDDRARSHAGPELAPCARERKRESRSLDTDALLRYESRLEMLSAAKIYFIVFGVLTIAGGIVGYVKAGSVASIIAGSISGVLLLIGAFVLPEHRMAGLVMGLIVSLLLAVRFIPAFLRTGKVMPAGLMAALSVLGIIAAIVAWLKE
jgi:uncharacterized membrane protein (UPF0136 family)